MNIWPEPTEELIDHGMTPQELGDLWVGLVEEILDPEYSNRTHNKRTYDAGCRGPLCRKAAREAGRRRQRSGVSETYMFVDRLIDYWEPIARERIEALRVKLLEQLTA